MVSIIEPEKGWVPGSSIWHPLIYVCTLNFSPGFRVGVSLTLTPSFYFVVLHFFTDYYFLLSLLYFLSAMPPPKLKLQHIYSLCIFSIQHYFDHKQFSKNHMFCYRCWNQSVIPNSSQVDSKSGFIELNIMFFV